MQQDALRGYLTKLIPQNSGYSAELEQDALRRHIPVIDREALHTLITLLHINGTSRILEIGTAVGYSAIRLLEEIPELEVISIERDKARAYEAEVNVKKAGLTERFQLIRGDAVESAQQAAQYGPFDALFIDAAKGSYDVFFRTFEPMVKPGGLITADNVLFRGYVPGTAEPESRRFINMSDKLRSFNESLMSSDQFQTMILPVGDGLLAARKKEKNTSVDM
ncbi:O-methyltransferase [Alkalicoccus luteus]|uniref:tRNA 5-hydroxyuridine methyltransferase n=1 Tax=Alkalicoccus luteus TaxID=1237094 RepID=A0A969TU02_9BACI|nr:O-methyltransferase [Alkalicoccus luteus]NJP36547.1 O-methyltransferase [Alkalicoccus luteus]